MSPRVGIAGFGLAGRYFHAPLLIGAGFEIAAILTKNPVRIKMRLLIFQLQKLSQVLISYLVII